MLDVICRELVEQGRQASKAQDYEGALRKYQTALARHEVSWLYVNIGRMQQRLTRYQEAITSYERYLASPVQPGEEQDRAKAGGYLEQTKKALAAQQEPPAPPAATVVQQDPAPAPQIKPDSRAKTKWIVLGGLAGAVLVGGVVGGVIYGVRAQVPDDIRDLHWTQVGAALSWGP